jgi:lysophospholipase L1-like esterase
MILRVIALLAAAACGTFAQSEFYLKNGDRVVFYGDSITDQRLYTTFVETYAVTRFPTGSFTFVHSGWGGDRVSGGGGGPIDQRLERDVFAYKPTVMTIMLGMNDAGYKPFDQSLFDTFSKGYEHIIDSVKSTLPGIRITVIEPSPFDDVTQTPRFEGGYNAVLLRYSEFVKELAERDRLNVADLNRPMVEDLKRAYASSPEDAKKIIPDRVHPGAMGHLLMAEALLKAWNAPAVVSDVDLDMGSHSVAKSANATVTKLAGMTWTETDASLPMPIDWTDPLTKLAVNSSDFLEAIDREMLRVRGLTPGKWTLKIDGQDVGAFTSEELAEGINLARYNTPMMQQAATVHGLTLKHAHVHNTKWRNIQVPLTTDSSEEKDAALKALDNLDAEYVRAQHKAAQPAPHAFELVPQS